MSDELQKPDMKAVLQRTRLAWSTEDFLLPVIEAVSNGIHGIEARFGGVNGAHEGQVKIVFRNATDPGALEVTVSDNGIGLNKKNYEEFKIPFSGHKLDRNGRGFGRFIAFKVFKYINYTSSYEIDGELNHRCFEFDVFQEKEIKEAPHGDDNLKCGVTVRYKEVREGWENIVEFLTAERVSQTVATHFMPYFLYGWLPRITIEFNEEPARDITEEYARIFVSNENGEFECDIDGAREKVSYRITRLPLGGKFKSHCLLLSAADRIVGNPIDLKEKIGRSSFEDEQGNRYVVVVVAAGDAFDARLNDTRTSVDLSQDGIREIVNHITQQVIARELAQIKSIKSAQVEAVRGVLRRNPILKMGLRGQRIEDYVESQPNNWSEEQFVSNLAVERARENARLEKVIISVYNDEIAYQQSIQRILKDVSDNTDALAEYVIHRKQIIDMVEAARKHGDHGKHSAERVIHEIIFKRFSDNLKTGMFDHNLWLVDDTLAFSPYITSDRAIGGGRRLKGAKIPDLAFFDDCLVLGEDDGTTITIIEFKRPSRDDYRMGSSKSDPILQVRETLEKVTRPGGVEKGDGTHFTFRGAIRKFGFLVADLTPTLIDVLRNYDFKNNVDPNIYYRYWDNDDILIQVYGYDLLVESAKKRNQAFFSVLFGE